LQQKTKQKQILKLLKS